MATSTRVRTPRRRREWARSLSFVSVPSNGTANADLMLPYRGQGGTRTGTVAAVRLSFLGNMATPTLVGGLAVGLIVGPTGGPGAAPTVNPNADWMLNHVWFAHSTGNVADSTIVENDIYIKSMRKVPDLGDTLWLVLSELSGQTTVAVTFAASILWMPS